MGFKQLRDRLSIVLTYVGWSFLPNLRAFGVSESTARELGKKRPRIDERCPATHDLWGSTYEPEMDSD